MTEDNYFGVYYGNHIPMAGQPLVVLVADTKFMTRYSEYYIILNHSKSEKYFKLVTAIDVPDKLEAEVNIEFLLSFALEGANGKLDNYLFELYEKTKMEYLYLKNYSLKKTEDNLLLRAHLIADFDNELKDILNSTKSEKLKEELRKILSLPKLIIQ